MCILLQGVLGVCALLTNGKLQFDVQTAYNHRLKYITSIHSCIQEFIGRPL